MSDSILNVAALSGSLRRASFNTALARAAQELAPPSMKIQLVDLSELPLYNDDLRTPSMPAPVETFRAALAAADAVLFVSPEYNYSVPGVLKNAIDWASRPPVPHPFDNKAAAIMSASPGMLGGARMQYHLRQIAVFLNLHVVNKPEIMVARAAEKFDADLKLTDEATRKLITQQLVALETLARTLRAPRT